MAQLVPPLTHTCGTPSALNGKQHPLDRALDRKARADQDYRRSQWAAAACALWRPDFRAVILDTLCRRYVSVATALHEV